MIYTPRIFAKHGHAITPHKINSTKLGLFLTSTKLVFNFYILVLLMTVINCHCWSKCVCCFIRYVSDAEYNSESDGGKIIYNAYINPYDNIRHLTGRNLA